MKITLCGSAKFESEFKRMNEKLTLAGHVVYSLAVYPSDKAGQKNWYTEVQKKALDAAHKAKIDNSDAIYVIMPGGYIGESTQSEIDYARSRGKKLMTAYGAPPPGFHRTCPYDGCYDPAATPPCPLCYE